MTTAMPLGALAAIRAGLSHSGPFVTTTTRVPAGRRSRSRSSPTDAHSGAQLSHPDERKAKSVTALDDIDTTTASPAGVTPCSSCTAEERSAGRGGPLAPNPANVTGR